MSNKQANQQTNDRENAKKDRFHHTLFSG